MEVTIDDDTMELANSLMVEITGRLEQLAALAADQQLSRSSSRNLLAGVKAVEALIQAHAQLTTSPDDNQTSSATS